MPTITTSTIKKQGGDYSTVQAWEDACPADLVVADIVWKGEIYGVDDEWIASGQWLSVAGTTTDSTRYKWLTAAQGESFQDHANKLTNPLRYNPTVGVAVSSDPSSTITKLLYVGENYFRMERLQLKCYGSSGGEMIDIPNGGVIVRDCIIQSSYGPGGRFIDIHSSAAFVNCLVRSPTTLQVDRMFSLSYSSTAGGVRNCTVVRDSDLAESGIGIYVSSASAVAKNTASFGPMNCFSIAIGPHSSADYNATDDADAFGANSVLNLTYTDMFVNTTSAAADYRVRSTATALQAGTRDQTLTQDLDILGQSRSTTTPTIGAMEIVQGGVVVLPLIANYRRQMEA